MDVNFSHQMWLEAVRKKSSFSTKFYVMRRVNLPADFSESLAVEIEVSSESIIFFFGGWRTESWWSTERRKKGAFWFFGKFRAVLGSTRKAFWRIVHWIWIWQNHRRRKKRFGNKKFEYKQKFDMSIAKFVSKEMFFAAKQLWEKKSVREVRIVDER